jgi:hypothetical protein
MVVVAVVTSPTSSIVVSAWAVLTATVVVVDVAVVVDARGPSASFNGVPGVTVGPVTALDRRRYALGPVSAILMPSGGRV